VTHQWIFVNSNGFGIFLRISGLAMCLISAAKLPGFGLETADFGRESDARIVMWRIRELI
jgi:hypothetical protein